MDRKSDAVKERARDRAEQTFQRKQEAKVAASEYELEERALREKTARLRALRLGSDAEKTETTTARTTVGSRSKKRSPLGR